MVLEDSMSPQHGLCSLWFVQLVGGGCWSDWEFTQFRLMYFHEARGLGGVLFVGLVRFRMYWVSQWSVVNFSL